MRIALLTRRFDSAGGGTERDLIVTAQGLREAGHQVTIFADEIRGETGGWEVRRVGAGPRLGRALSLLRFAWTAAPAARRAGTDMVLSFARCVGADVIRSGGGAAGLRTFAGTGSALNTCPHREHLKVGVSSGRTRSSIR